MSKVPFKVSARTARLIGLQNFTNVESALTELVKNSYDADATRCVIIFDNLYNKIPADLTEEEYYNLKNQTLVNEFYSYTPEKNKYTLSEIPNSTDTEKLKSYFNSLCRIFLLDNGEGMTDTVIENNWMVIGTNNKQYEVYTKGKRVKTGEKGIGRFALDRIGNKVEMLTKPDIEKHGDKYKDKGFLWQIQWDIFDKEAITLNEIEVDIIDSEIPDYSRLLKQTLSIPLKIQEIIDLDAFQHGTLFEIRSLRDTWDDYTIEKLFSNLELLIPPHEIKDFKVFVFSTKDYKLYGEVLPVSYSDYDYKLEAKVSATGEVQISIYRNEYDLTRFDAKLYKQKSFQEGNFTKKEDFERGFIQYNKKIAELIPGFEDEFNSLEKLGAFSLTVYFLKTTLSKDHQETYLYKNINPSTRKKWLEAFAGIKLFRDNFRVKPYGEPNESAFDWLGLGIRAVRSPAGVGKKEGGWKVRPNTLAGIINISRLNNISFKDVSSRSGIQEYPVFILFKTIIIKFIEELERDRSYIARAIREYRENHEQVSPGKAKSVAKKYLGTETTNKQSGEEAKEDAKLLAQYVLQKDRVIEEMKSEQAMLRILASNALVTAGFAHELESIKNNLVSRVDRTKKYLQIITDVKVLDNLKEFENPLILLDDIKKDDLKLKEWLNFSLLYMGRDKRRRHKIDLHKYFKEYEKSWRLPLESRGIKRDFQVLERDLKMRAFEIDLDCILNNLLINSFYIFTRSDAPAQRKITLRIKQSKKNIEILYRDSGPGLDKNIVPPEKIFEAHFTTKRNPRTGEETGTGLGMWLVKTFVEENNGQVKLLFDEPGFGLLITFFNKITEED